MATYGSLLLAGLAGSLHCVGMCGPILLGFDRAFERVRLSVEGSPLGRSSVVLLEFGWYHLGRLWTYGLLGLAAGFAGEALRASGAWLGWQRPVAIGLAAAVILCGLLLCGVVPGVRLERVLGAEGGCRRWAGWRWFDVLVQGRGPGPRLLLGAVMGLLPCGLVYAMLVAVAALPHPVYAAAGMITFGIGTLPSLSAVLLASRSLPAWIRSHGTTLAGLALIAAGVWMMGRTLAVSSQSGHCPFCTDAAADKTDVIAAPAGASRHPMPLNADPTAALH